MKKLSLNVLALLLMLFTAASCSDTQSYADLVNQEEDYIEDFKNYAGIEAIEIDEDVLNNWTTKVLRDSIDPGTLVKKDQWYMVNEGDFKRLYFRIKDFGNRQDGASFYKNKINVGSYVLVRYEDCYLLNDFKEFDDRKAVDNLDPYSYQMIYNWNTSYYATTYYAYQYGNSTSQNTCTSGGLAFPVRFMWFGGEAELIVPFSLVESDYSSSYLTLYYGKVRYTKPSYVPE